MNNDLIKKIREIQQDTNLSSADKSKEIFKLMNPNFNADEHISTDIVCNHYERKCHIFCAECNKFWPCFRCHNEHIKNHELDTKKINKIICCDCSTEQEPSNNCIKCNIKFSNYYCDICHLWQNKDIKIFHCDDCGICRVIAPELEREDYKHCNICDVCFPINSNHICNKTEGGIKNNSKCPICREELFNSQSSIMNMVCGHTIHNSCFQEYIIKDFRCPICKKTLSNDIEKLKEYWEIYKTNVNSQIMPDEFINWKAKIFCNDCENKTETSYHFLGHECQNCNGWNTSVETIIKNNIDNN